MPGGCARERSRRGVAPPRLTRVAARIAVAALAALVVACSGGRGAPTATLAPTAVLDGEAASPSARDLVVNEPESFEGYTLFSWGSVYLIDHRGQTIHKWTPNPQADLVKLLDNGNLLTQGNREIDAEGNVVWEYSHLQHHDLLKMPNGNVLILSRLVIPREEAVALGANPDALSCPSLRATHIIEVRPTGPTDGDVVWRWSALDHLIQDFDPNKPNYGAVADHPELIDMNFNLDPAGCRNGEADWTHANALDYNAALDQIMITVRRFSEIWIIDHSTSAEEAAGHAGGNSGKGGDILYRWGNPRAYRRGNDADQRLFFPHNAHWIREGLPGAGNVLIFNNGNEYTGSRRGYSSVDEIAPPSDGRAYRMDAGSAYGPGEIVWSYAADPPHSFYAERGSGAQRLPNGDTLIADGPAARIFEVTREGETVWEFTPRAADAHLLSRSYRYPPDHPGIRNLLAFYSAAYLAATDGDPIARSLFDLYLVDGALVYVRETCGREDAAPRFFLHVEPERMDDLPQGRQRYGFDNLNFDFLVRGAVFDGKCAARVPLPDYPIASVRSGQFTPDGELWRVEFEVGDGSLSRPALR